MLLNLNRSEHNYNTGTGSRSIKYLLPIALALAGLAALVVLLFKYDGNQHQAAFVETYSGPIVITKGGTYTGNWESRDSEVPAVEIKTDEPVVIEHSNIRGAGYLIKSWGHNVNVTVRHTNGFGLPPTIYYNYKKPRRFLTADVFKNVVVENCYMEHTGGVAVGTKYTGNGSASETIRIRYNKVKNIDGRIYQDTELVNFVGFNFRGAVPHIEIAWNEVINEPNNSLVADNINLSNSRGTPNSPMRIHNNYIQGAYPYPATEKDYSGGGIITDSWYEEGMGDPDSVSTAYVKIYDNQTVDLCNYNYAIAGGNNIEIYNNRAITSALLQDGAPVNTHNIGIYGYDYYKTKVTYANKIYNNTINVMATCADERYNELYFPDGTVKAFDNTFSPDVIITKQHEQMEYKLWKEKLRDNKIALGPAKPLDQNNSRKAQRD